MAKHRKLKFAILQSAKKEKQILLHVKLIVRTLAQKLNNALLPLVDVVQKNSSVIKEIFRYLNYNDRYLSGVIIIRNFFG